jgi:hypothetical protein
MIKSIGVAALTLAVISTATAAYAAMTWSSAVTVTKIDVEADPTGAGIGEVYLVFSAAPHTTSCSAGGSYWVIGGNADTVKAIQSAATGAKLSGSAVKVLFNNSYSGSASCQGGGTTGIPVLRGLEVQ